MSSATPDDLVVLFRGLPRRLSAAQDQAPTAAIDRELTALRSLLADALAIVSAPSSTAPASAPLDESTVDRMAQQISEHIDHRPADGWDDATLDSLRAVALEIGATLRSISAIGERFSADE